MAKHYRPSLGNKGLTRREYWEFVANVDNLGGTYLAAVIVVAVIAYFIPTFVALWRGSASDATVMWVNILLGWSLVGWIIALLIACFSQTRRQRKIEKLMLKKLQERA